MKQGVLHHGRVRLLLKKGMSGYRPGRKGERKRKSVRGCIVNHDMSVLSSVIVRKGDNEIPGLTDSIVDRRLGPKRANKIRKLFDLDKEDDVRKYVVKRKTDKCWKVPKIQRLITPQVLRRKRKILADLEQRMIRSRADRAAYEKRVEEYRQEQKEALVAEVAKKKKETKKK